MARSRTSKFDASEAITNELIRIIERGVLPWRKPWTAGGSARPSRSSSTNQQRVKSNRPAVISVGSLNAHRSANYT